MAGEIGDRKVLLQQLKDEVEDARKYQDGNYKYSNLMANIIYDCALNAHEKAGLSDLDKPIIEANILESHASRLVGEFILNKPSILVEDKTGEMDPAMIDAIDGHLRSITDAGHDEKADIYQESLVRSFSVMKYWTEYKHARSFEQVLKWGGVYDSTLTYFDPMARKKSKEDAQYAGELFPKTLDEVLRMGMNLKESDFAFTRGLAVNGNFSWSYQTNTNKKVALLCQHYKRKEVRRKLIYAADGRSYTTKEYKTYCDWIEANTSKVPPAIIKTRMTDMEVIMRYLFIESQILEEEETAFPGIPLIWVDGNSKNLATQGQTGDIRQKSRSYFHHAVDTQKFMNLAMQTYADELISVPPIKMSCPIEAVPDKPEWAASILKPQGKNTNLYQQYSEDGTQEYNQPTYTVRPQMPPEIAQAFFQTPAMIQNILGAHGSELGNPDNTLSGKALLIGSTNSSAAASPYVSNFLYAWEVLLQALVDMMPKYYTLPRSIPVMDGQGNRSSIKLNSDLLTPTPSQQINQQSMQQQPPQQMPQSPPMGAPSQQGQMQAPQQQMQTPSMGQPQQQPQQTKPMSFNYQKGDLKVSVAPGVSLEVQNQRSLEFLFSAAPQNPGIAQLINGPGLPLVFEMMNIRHKDAWIELAKEQLQTQQQQAAAAAQQGAQNPEIQLKQQELTMKSQQNVAQNHIEMIKINSQENIEKTKAQIAAAKIRNDAMKTHADFIIDQGQEKIDQARLQTERAVHHTELGMKHADQEHSHLTDMIGLHHEINQSEREHERENAKTNEEG